ncbi:PadR family transcriptional regulator [Microbacterium kribbense]|uniref:PadR family transcriptional regulator n=1 Tax=Microbacterium kribbense TaxID=433645 RepID=A0ABP7FYP9_9MICO
MKHAALTPLGVMVLALLREGDMHPYEMIRLLRLRRQDAIIKITNGTFYHTVGRLQRQGLIAEVGVDRDGNRPERTTYALTDAGPQALAAWVRTHLADADGTTGFRVALAEAHNLDRAEVADLIGIRRTALARELAEVQKRLTRAQALNILEQFAIESHRRRAMLRAEIEWTDSFLERLARPDYLWGVTDIPVEHQAGNLALRKAARA